MRRTVGGRGRERDVLKPIAALALGEAPGLNKDCNLRELSEQDVAAWYPKLFRTALRLTGSEHDADDLTQQAFFKALNNWGQFQARSGRLAWMFTILMNCTRDFFRRNRVRAAEPLDEWALPVSAGFDDCVAEDAQRREELAELRKSIEQLSPTIRQTFVATVLDGYSYEQAAEMLAIPVGTISSRVHQARQELKATMTRLFGGHDHD